MERKISLVIPVYNEEGSLLELYERIKINIQDCIQKELT